MQELDSSAAFDARHDEEFFATLPAFPAVFSVEAAAGLVNSEPYLFRTANLRERLKKLLGPRDPASKRLNLRELVSRIHYRIVGSSFELNFLSWQHARRLWPSTYRERLPLRPSALLKVSLSNAYPRCYSTRRIHASGFYFGPFASRRAADMFASGFLDLFKIRRCQIKIRRDPHYPGCMYSEMKMCLAPCFAGCSQAEYSAEVHRATAFLASTGESLTAELERERELASETLDFERAAAVHRRVEKVSDALRGLPELARPIDSLDAIILQRGAEKETVAVFFVRSGRIDEPRILRFAELASEPRSVERIFREWVESHDESADADAGPPAQRNRELEDHLSVLARWFYKKPRAGEIFFRDGDARTKMLAPQESLLGPVLSETTRRTSEWPYRRILRACSRLLAPAESDVTGQSG